MTTKTTCSDVKRRGIGFYLVRVELQGAAFAIQRRGREVAVLVSAERFASLERAERDARDLAAQLARLTKRQTQ
jgi:PHD/YefM family antitoxin component YafN of YafNO toxin-antitoxin module